MRSALSAKALCAGQTPSGADRQRGRAPSRDVQPALACTARTCVWRGPSHDSSHLALSLQGTCSAVIVSTLARGEGQGIGSIRTPRHPGRLGAFLQG